MAMIPQPGQGLIQPLPVIIDMSSKSRVLGLENERSSFVDPAKSFTNYFDRVHRRYKSMETTNIENLANRLLQEQGLAFRNFVRKETSLEDTFFHRFIEAKTPLGEVLQELQNSQESSSRKLLSKEIFRQAEKEAKELTEKEVAIAVKKGERREGSNEISALQKRQTLEVKKSGPEFQVNTYTIDDQFRDFVARLSNGKFVVTWTSKGQDGGGGFRGGVYGQIFSANGTKNGSEFKVNTYTTDDQVGGSVASLNNGRFVVVWNSRYQDGTIQSVFGQIFNEDGTKNGSEFKVNTFIADNQLFSSVASLNNGKFIVTWTSFRQDGSGWGVYGQIFNADGTKSGSEFLATTYTTNDQGISSVAGLSNDRFVITWDSDGQDGDLKGVFGQIFNEDGTKYGPEFPVNTHIISDQWISSVASLNNGKFVVTWQSWDQDGSGEGIFGQIFNEDGTKNGSEFSVNTYTTVNQQLSSVTSFDNDTFIVTWTSFQQDGAIDGVYGQMFNADGTKNGPEFPVNTYTTNDQTFSSVASLSNDTFVVTWTSEGQDGSGRGIFGQIFETSIQTNPTSSSISHPSSSPISQSEVSGAERQTRSIALTALSWMLGTIKGTLGY